VVHTKGAWDGSTLGQTSQSGDGDDLREGERD